MISMFTKENPREETTSNLNLGVMGGLVSLAKANEQENPVQMSMSK